jgi:hypothetical protein
LFAWWHDRDALYQDRHWYRRSAELLQKKSIQVIEAAEKLGYEASYDKDGKFTGLTQRQDQAEISN